MGEFYSDLMNFWNELNTHIKVLVYTCSVRKCEAAGKIIKMYEDDKSHYFSMGLNDDSYSNIRSQICTRTAAPS